MLKPNSKIEKLKALASAGFTANYSGAAVPKREDYLQNMGGKSHGGMVEVSNELEQITMDIDNTDEANELYAPIFGSYNFEKFPVPFSNTTVDFVGTVPSTGKGIVLRAGMGLTATQFREKFRNRPGTISEIDYDFGDSTQLSKDWIRHYSDGINETKKPFIPKTSYDINQQAVGRLITRNFFAEATDQFTLFVKLAKAPAAGATRTVSMTFTIGSQVSQEKMLRGITPVSTNQSSGLDVFGR
jgi:hypothetical protein